MANWTPEQSNFRQMLDEAVLRIKNGGGMPVKRAAATLAYEFAIHVPQAEELIWILANSGRLTSFSRDDTGEKVMWVS